MFIILSRKYLSDPTEDVRVATETLLADFLREIKEVTLVRKRFEEETRSKLGSERAESIRRPDTAQGKLPDLSLENSERSVFITENDDNPPEYMTDSGIKDDLASDIDDRDTGGK